MPGRPALPEGEAREERYTLRVRLSQAERARLSAAFGSRKLSTVLRELALSRADELARG